MDQHAKESREALRGAETAFIAHQEIVEEMEKECSHKWLDPVQKSHTSPGYHVPADPTAPGPCAGAMSNRLHGYDIPSQTKVWWERECSKCGKIEKTSTSKRKNVEYEPIF